MLEGEPLTTQDARQLIREILVSGTVTFVDPHALDALAADGLGTVDAINVLRGGTVDPPEWENRAWRYRVRTARICVVIEFESESELIVVTCWRYQR
jgi:hypothetical protein